MDAVQSRKLELSRSPLGTLYRRTHFLVQYVCARAQPEVVARFLPIVEKSFEHPWVAECELQIRFWPGHDRTWPWSSNSLRPMHWDAPIAVSVFRKRRGKRRLALCFSMYLIGKTLHIKQIQGVSGTDVPSELRGWPKMFIEACRTFARQEALNEVKMPRADSLYSYHSPGLNPELLPDSRERAMAQIKKGMELLYDANALELGFIPDGTWFKWRNPNSGLRQLEILSCGALALLHLPLRLTLNVGALCDNLEYFCTFCALGFSL
jgi:hypothetical protein